MRIALVVPQNPHALEDAIDPHLGLLSIAAVLRREGHEVSYIESALRDPLPVANLYGITVHAINYREAVVLAQQARELTDGRAPLVAGGPLVAALPERFLQEFDAVVCGEGEQALLDYIQQREPGIYRREYANYRTGRSPAPAYDLVDSSRYTRTVMGQRAFGLMTSRGCGFNCAFCSNDRLSVPYRRQPVAAALRDLRQAKRDTGLNAVIFWDNNFELRVTMELLAGIEQEQIIFSYYQRGKPHPWDTLLYAAGGRQTFIGIESGDPEMLRRMNKKLTLEQMRQAVGNAKAAGIAVRIGLVFGFPGETAQTLARTRSFVESLQPDQVFLSFFAPFPGSDVWAHPERYGVTGMASWEQMAIQSQSGYIEPLVETEQMSKADWKILGSEMLEWWKGLPRNREADPSWGGPGGVK